MDNANVAVVGITLGKPRFPLKYDVVATLRQLAPDGEMFKVMDRATFEPMFRAKLDRLGVATIRDLLDSLSRAEGGRDLVLCCFEDVRKPGEWCHRQVFAAWWEEHTGQPVEEFPDDSKVKIPKPAADGKNMEQLSLLDMPAEQPKKTGFWFT